MLTRWVTLAAVAFWLAGCATTAPAVFYDAQQRSLKGQFDLDNCRTAAGLYRPAMEELERKWAAGTVTTVEAATFFRQMAGTLDCMAANYPYVRGSLGAIR